MVGREEKRGEEGEGRHNTKPNVESNSSSATGGG
jgi:hypothetical protein